MLLAASRAAVLRLLLLMPSIWLARCCMETFFSHARQDPAQMLTEYSVTGDSGSCSCCGLCHQHTDCASLSYNTASRQCQLYSSVASYATIIDDKHWLYFVMPDRSEHHQLCRVDSDCQEKGDTCRASVCSQLDTITCQVIYESLGSGERLATDDHHHRVLPGWLNGQPLALACYMREGRGYTRLLLTDQKHPFTHDNILSFNEDLTDSQGKHHSILRLAEDILQTSGAPNYRILVFPVGGGRTKLSFEMELPHSEPVLATSPRPMSGTVLLDAWSLAKPGLLWTSTDGFQLVSIALERSAQAVQGDIASTDGQSILEKNVFENNKIAVFISE